MKLHPANQLALWLWLASLLPWLERQFLYGATALVALLAFLLARSRLKRSLPRLRWLLLAVGGVYGWTTPGEYLWSGWLSPTHEGLLLGADQILRLFAVAASLQVLLTRLDRSAIFAGLHALAAPLDWLGLSRDRMALRLTLTLEMMENLLEMRQSLAQLIVELKSFPVVEEERTTVLQVQAMGWLQRGMLVLVLLGVSATLYLGGTGAWA